MKIKFTEEIAGIKKGSIKEVPSGRGARLIARKFAVKVEDGVEVTPSLERAEKILEEKARIKKANEATAAETEKALKSYKKKQGNRPKSKSETIIASAAKGEEGCDGCKEGCEDCEETVMKHEDNIEIKDKK